MFQMNGHLLREGCVLQARDPIRIASIGMVSCTPLRSAHAGGMGGLPDGRLEEELPGGRSLGGACFCEVLVDCIDLRALGAKLTASHSEPPVQYGFLLLIFLS